MGQPRWGICSTPLCQVRERHRSNLASSVEFATGLIQVLITLFGQPFGIPLLLVLRLIQSKLQSQGYDPPLLFCLLDSTCVEKYLFTFTCFCGVFPYKYTSLFLISLWAFVPLLHTQAAVLFCTDSHLPF